ncbi:EAL domain-containing protein [Vibrio sp. RC27]
MFKSKLKRYSSTRLHTKLMLGLAILVCIAMVSFTFVFIEQERETRLAELERRADRVTTLVSRSIAYAVWNIDFVAIDEQLASLISDPEIVHVSISATGYGELKAATKPYEILVDPIEREQPIFFSNEGSNMQQIGTVHVVLTREVVENAIALGYRVAMIFVLVILSVVTGATYILLRMMVGRPVNHLQNVVEQISEGDFEARCMVESGDELGSLATRVNLMADRLRNSDRRMRDSQENLAITLDSIGDGVIVTDEQGLITRMNPTAESMTGWAQFDALGLPLTDVFHVIDSETREKSVSPVQQVIEHGQVMGLTTHTILISQDGHEYQIADNAAPIRKIDGEIVGVVLVFSDVSEQYEMHSELSATQAHLQAVLDAIPDLLFEVDIEGRLLLCHAHDSNLLVVSAEQLIGKLIGEILPPEATQICMEAIAEAAKNGSSSGAIYSLDLIEGEMWFELSIAAMQKSEDKSQHFIMLSRNITERKEAEAKLQQAASVFVNAGEGIIVTDTQGIILDVNQAFTRITGFEREDAIGKKTNILRSDRHDDSFYKMIWSELHRVGSWSGEIWNQRKNGEVFIELLSINSVRDTKGKVLQYVALFSDITSIKAHQHQLEYIAHFDALTNLPNRVLLAERLLQAMELSKEHGKQLAVAFLDLDGFKEINDVHSHQMGDNVLVTLTQRMTETLREGDTLARIGGDEFVAVFNGLDSLSDSLPLVGRLLTAAAQPMQIGSLNLQVSASIGLTYYPQDQNIDADQLLRQADQAMYQAKVSGKNRYHIFDADHDSNLRWFHESLDRIRLALENDEFVLFYQPKVNMRSGKVVGVEALIRWMHPEKGLMEPISFLPIIEDHPLAVDIGEWVIETALAQLDEWQRAGLDQLEMSVNVGARQLQQESFVSSLTSILNKYPNVDPSQLQIEVLETSALADMDLVSKVIGECAGIGVSFALDDFGTGYSSLTYLKRLNVAMLKIDRSFVRDMLDDADDLAILQGVIGLAMAFKRQVIAEGVETIEHGDALLQLGCELAQGFGISRPMLGKDIPDWIGEWLQSETWNKLNPNKWGTQADIIFD